MFKITSDDLRRQSNGQLSSLFNHIQLNVGWLRNPSPERSAALKLLAMIRIERAQRMLWP